VQQHNLRVLVKSFCIELYSNPKYESIYRQKQNNTESQSQEENEQFPNDLSTKKIHFKQENNHKSHQISITFQIKLLTKVCLHLNVKMSHILIVVSLLPLIRMLRTSTTTKHQTGPTQKQEKKNEKKNIYILTKYK
jgi:hypothetical protein